MYNSLILFKKIIAFLQKDLHKTISDFIVWGILLLMIYAVIVLAYFNTSGAISKNDIFNLISYFAILLLTGYTFYFNYIEKFKVDLYIGDEIRFVKLANSTFPRIHLYCTFVNNTNRSGVINKLRLLIQDPNNSTYVLEWNEFFIYLGNQGATAESLPFPISIEGKSSVNKGVQFNLDCDGKKDSTGKISNELLPSIDLIKGTYVITISGWLNETNINEQPYLKKTFKINLSAYDLARANDLNARSMPVLISFPIIYE